MQILPTKNALFGDKLLDSFGHTTEEASSFYEELQRQQDARKSVNASEAVSVQAALENPKETRTPLVTAPYSRNTSDGITYTMSEVCFTKQELTDLYRKLEDAGAPSETLTGLSTLAHQPDGATLAQVVASLHPEQNTPPLTEAETNAIHSLSDKIDPSGELGKKVIGALEDGKPQTAWKHITTALSQMDPTTSITADRNELAALGKALGLSANAQQQLLGNFGPYASITMTAGTFTNFLGPAQNDFLVREQNEQKLAKALDTTLQPLLSKARKRMETEKSAGELSNRRTEQSKVLIEKTVMRKVHENLDATQGQGEGLAQATPVGKAGKDAGEATEGTGKRGLEDVQALKKGAHAETERPLQENPRVAQPGVQQNATPQPGADQRDSRGRERDDNRQPSKRDGWEPLLQKVETRAAAPTTQNLLFGAAAAQATAPANLTAEAAKPMPLAPRQALAQVEQAMLSAMRDGTKRLDIQLDPGEMGTLTLTLTSRNGEVSATIRSERGETADMINRQLDVLRTNLEQQGIKVDKLEVQNQAADNNANQQWENMQQHNARQEESARRETLERIKMLAKHRNSETNMVTSALEQGVHSPMHTAGNAAQSIYIIA